MHDTARYLEMHHTASYLHDTYRCMTPPPHIKMSINIYMIYICVSVQDGYKIKAASSNCKHILNKDPQELLWVCALQHTATHCNTLQHT